MTLLAAAPSYAQYVKLDGSYGEANGQIVDIPNNQPQHFEPNCVLKARCRGYKKVRPSQTTMMVAGTYKRPDNGVPRRAPLQTVQGGLAVGASIKIPALFFGQDPANGPGLPGVGAGPVLQNAVEWISTAYYARMPAAQRGHLLNHPNPPGPNTMTRVMRAQPAGALPGQAGRELSPAISLGGGRKKIVHTMDNLNSNDSGTLTYTEGPNRFGGVMTALLDGYSDLNVRAFGAFDGYFPAQFRPVIGVQRAGVNPKTAMGGIVNNFHTRNGAGWNVPINGGQNKAPIIGPVNTLAVTTMGLPAKCLPAQLPPNPVNCQKPVSLPVLETALTAMGGLAAHAPYILLDNGNFLAAADSVKYNFPFTTGTVTMMLDVRRGNGQTYKETLTGMGYDTVTLGGARNVGLVAGSYTNRASGNTANNLNFQILGVDLHVTPVPEVASATALAAGVALLGVAARRRR